MPLFILLTEENQIAEENPRQSLLAGAESHDTSTPPSRGPSRAGTVEDVRRESLTASINASNPNVQDMV